MKVQEEVAIGKLNIQKKRNEIIEKQLQHKEEKMKKKQEKEEQKSCDDMIIMELLPKFPGMSLEQLSKIQTVFSRRGLITPKRQSNFTNDDDDDTILEGKELFSDERKDEQKKSFYKQEIQEKMKKVEEFKKNSFEKISLFKKNGERKKLEKLKKDVSRGIKKIEIEKDMYESKISAFRSILRKIDMDETTDICDDDISGILEL